MIDNTVELVLTAVVFGLIGVFSPTRFAFQVMMLAGDRRWLRASWFLVGSTIVFAVPSILGLLGVAAGLPNESSTFDLYLGVGLLVIGGLMLVRSRSSADRPPQPPRHPVLGALLAGVGVSIQSPGRLLVLLAGGYRIGALANSGLVGLAYIGLMLAIWQVPVWGPMALFVFRHDRFAALERRARPALDRVESGVVGGVLIAFLGAVLVFHAVIA